MHKQLKGFLTLVNTVQKTLLNQGRDQGIWEWFSKTEDLNVEQNMRFLKSEITESEHIDNDKQSEYEILVSMVWNI